MASAEDGEFLQKALGRVEIKRRNCRVCNIPMNSDAENRIGVHIRCVYDVSKRQKYTTQGPRYGRCRPKDAR
jgi:hypothetical protein